MSWLSIGVASQKWRCALRAFSDAVGIHVIEISVLAHIFITSGLGGLSVHFAGDTEWRALVTLSGICLAQNITIHALSALNTFGSGGT